MPGSVEVDRVDPAAREAALRVGPADVRKVDPTGKQALFDAPVSAAPDRIRPGPRNEGRTALFSASPRRPGTVVIECSQCRARSRASLIDLALRVATGSAWWPLRAHQHWLRCPSCGHRHWCRIGWNE